MQRYARPCARAEMREKCAFHAGMHGTLPAMHAFRAVLSASGDGRPGMREKRAFPHFTRARRSAAGAHAVAGLLTVAAALTVAGAPTVAGALTQLRQVCASHVTLLRKAANSAA